jgi:hypothetical protein
MKFRLLDLLWLTTLTGCLLGWYVDRAKRANELERTVEVMRMYKNACVSNDNMYHREAAKMDLQYGALRAMASELERRLYAKAMNDTIKLRCPHCGQTKDDAPRADYDPPHAVLMVIPCDCTQGCKIDGGDYYDAAGNQIDWFEWTQTRNKWKSRQAD